MTNTGLTIILAIIAFGLGYIFRYLNLKYESKANLTSQQLRATVSASLDGIIIINSDGEILEFSEAAERIFGYNRIDILGKKMSELIVPERYREAHDAGMQRMRETGVAKILGQRIEIEAMRNNGEEFMSELAISRSPSSDGDIFIAFIRDISDAKAAEEALKEAKLKAEEASEVKSKFLAAMSHEIRTPFNAVLGILDILSESELNPDQFQLVETARKSSTALLRIINDTLDYAKITSGTVDVIDKPFKASDIFDDVKTLFDPVAQEKGLTLKIDQDFGTQPFLIGDAGRIKQVLMNFVSNAIKFTPSGEIELLIKTAYRKDGQCDLFCGVQDRGIGIPIDKQDALFGEFYMVDATDTREHEGTGLGLAICRRLIQMMGGEIGVKSVPEKGSLFWMSVPLTETSERAVNISPIVSSAADITGVNVLLAEDNKTNQMVITRMLNSLKAKVTIANNGQSALDHLETNTFDIILMDISMPVMGGLTATKHIRSKPSPYQNIPILALTAMANEDDIIRFINAGMNEVLIKPVSKTGLSHSIYTVLGESPVDPMQDKATPHDNPILNDLFEGATMDEIDMFKTQFHSDLSSALRDLSKALTASDRELAERTSHVIKGLAGTYGFTALSESAALTNSHCNSDKDVIWVNEGRRVEKIGQRALHDIDAVFSQIEVSAA